MIDLIDKVARVLARLHKVEYTPTGEQSREMREMAHHVVEACRPVLNPVVDSRLQLALLRSDAFQEPQDHDVVEVRRGDLREALTALGEPMGFTRRSDELSRMVANLRFLSSCKDGEAGISRCGSHVLKDAADQIERLAKIQELAGDYVVGLEEIRDAAWHGDDALERIRNCANRWISGGY